MSERDEFEEIYIAGLVREKSHYDPESDRHDIALRLSDKPSEGWRRIFDTELQMGTDPHSGAVDAEIQGDLLVAPGVTVKYFEETLWPWLKTAFRRTNDEYVVALAKNEGMAEAEVAHRTKLDAKLEEADKDLADLAERLNNERATGEEE